MFDYLKNGGSLNKAIEEIKHSENNKQSLGIIGYLTNGLLTRENVDSEAVISSLIPFIYREERETLDNYIRSRKK